jgi:hypothetical protein
MTSLPAGSPKCNCKNPDTCIHSFTLKVKEKTFTYKQNGFIRTVNVIAEEKKAVPISLSLVGKQCVSHNPLCPQGTIYTPEKANSLKAFNKGMTNYQAHYNSDKLHFFEKYDSIGFLVDYVLAKSTLGLLPTTSYTLRVGQCRGEPFVKKPLSFMDGLSQLFNFAPKDALWTYINIYPEYKWEASLVIGKDKEVEKYTDKELKKQQRGENADKGLAQRGHRGWTKRPTHSITDVLDIEGKLSCKLGSITHDYSATLKNEFKKKAKNIPFLDKAKQSLDMVGEALSTGKGGEGKITLLHTEILYPTFEIKGGGELKEGSAGLVYIERQVSLGFAPLVGLRMTLDLIQAFAAWYNMDVLMAAVREGLMSGEQAHEEGRNSAFIGMKFELVAEGAINLTLVFKSDEKNEWEWQKTDSAESKLSLTIEANVRAGVRFYIANGALTIGGKAVAEGCLGLDSPTKGKLPLVFYHNGITAKVYVSYTVGLSRDSKKTDKPTQTFPEEPSNSRNADQGKKTEKEWIIHDKLDKKDSRYRINFG